MPQTRQTKMPSCVISPQLVTIVSEPELIVALRTVIIEIPANTRLSHILLSRLLPRLQVQVRLQLAFSNISFSPKTLVIPFLLTLFKYFMIC